MVDGDAQEDQSNKETSQQCSSALSMFDRNAVEAIGNLDALVDHVAQSPRLRATEGLEPFD